MSLSVRERTTGKIVDLLFKLISDIPSPSHPARADDPVSRAQKLVRVNAAFAASISAGLSVPAGPLGILSVLPDLATIWRVQQKMVVDIAAAFGKSATLTREQMLYCLFRHTAAQAVRLLAVRTGERILVKEATLAAIQGILRKIGVRMTRQFARRAIGHWLPLLGAIGVGAYSYFQTKRVGQTAIELFSQDMLPEADNRISQAEKPLALLPPVDAEPSPAGDT